VADIEGEGIGHEIESDLDYGVVLRTLRKLLERVGQHCPDGTWARTLPHGTSLTLSADELL
jgi:hypothetical protein